MDIPQSEQTYERVARGTAAALKAAVRGKAPAGAMYGDKLVQSARTEDRVKIGMALNDQFVTVDLPWADVRNNNEADLVTALIVILRGETIQ